MRDECIAAVSASNRADELRAARRLLLLHGSEHWHPPAQHDGPDGNNVVVAYDVAARLAQGQSMDPSANGDWIDLPGLVDAPVEVGRAGPPVAWFQRGLQAMYACTQSDPLAEALDRRDWQLTVRMQRFTPRRGGLTIMYLLDGEYWQCTLIGGTTTASLNFSDHMGMRPRWWSTVLHTS